LNYSKKGLRGEKHVQSIYFRSDKLAVKHASTTGLRGVMDTGFALKLVVPSSLPPTAVYF